MKTPHLKPISQTLIGIVGSLFFCAAVNGQTTGLPVNFVLVDNFDAKSNIKTGWQVYEYGVYTNMTMVTDRKRAGTKGVKVYLRKSDPIAQYGSKRTELTHNNYSTSSMVNTSLRWWAFSNYFPTGYGRDPAEEIVAQWHDKSSRCSARPVLALEIKDDRFRLMIRYSTIDYCKTASQVTRTFDLGPVPKDKWIDWVINYNPKPDSSGYVTVWMNGVKKIVYKGPCHYTGSIFPYFKIGLYKWQWVSGFSGVQSNQTSRTYYFDEVKVANLNARASNFGVY